MINLLPPDHRAQLRAAQANTLLVRYNIFLAGALIFLGLALGVVFIYLNATKANAEKTTQENQAKVSSYAKVKSDADAFRASLSTAKQVLDKEITYTKTITTIAQLMPKGTILQGLNLDATTFGTPITFNFQAKDYTTALAIKDAFQSSPLFTDVHLQSLALSADNKADYPYTVNLSLIISKDAAN